MKKILAFLILLIPFIVSAEDVTYEVCKSGCTYDSVDATYQAIITLDTSKQYNITILNRSEQLLHMHIRSFPTKYSSCF